MENAKIFNKLIFNNLIVSNKQKIQRGQNQTFNKLVQKKRKLTLTLEKRPDDAKSKERLRKTSICLEQLKIMKLNHVETITTILLLEKPPNAILTNGLSTPYEIAIAMLTLNKLVKEVVTEICEKLKLNESNQAWRNEILQPSKRRIKINRTDDKRKKRQELKHQKTMERNRNDWIAEHSNENKFKSQEIDDGVDTKIIQTNVGSWHVETLPQQCDEIKVARQKKSKPFETELKISNQIEKEKTKEYKTCIKDEQMFEPRLIDDAVAVGDEPAVTHIVDPFFITASGESYLSTAVNTRVTADTTTKIPAQQRVKDKNTNNKRNMSNNAAGATTKRSRSVHDKVNVGTNENLHPSWEAKQKQKPTISTFRGKKTVFDNDGSVCATKLPDKSMRHKKEVQKDETTVSSLHPSWAAKQKHKPIINNFQGKKTTFTDVD